MSIHELFQALQVDDPTVQDSCYAFLGTFRGLRARGWSVVDASAVATVAGMAAGLRGRA